MRSEYARSTAAVVAGRRLSPARLQAARTAEPRQRIAQGDPVDVVVEVDVGLRCDVDRRIEVGEDDVDLVRVMGRFAEQIAATGTAKAARPVVGRAEAHQLRLAGEQLELRVRHRDPGHEAGAVVAPAHRAMAVRAKHGRWPNGESNRTTEAPTEHLR